MGKKHKKHKSERRLEEEKPHLKLVLKLGAEGRYDSDYAAHSPLNGDEYGDHERSHKKKKRKRKHDRHRNSDEYKIIKKTKIADDFGYNLLDDDDNDTESLSMQNLNTENENQSMSEKSPISNNSFEDSPYVDIKNTELSKEDYPELTGYKKVALEKLLEHLLCQLERKDPHDIFAWPVNDIIAPGYSSVIKEPMDFSTMRKKIQTHKYNALINFKNDFKMMTDNCCAYNRPETIYYQAAKKLFAAGMKIMSKERLLNMKKTLGFLHEMDNKSVADILGISIQKNEDIVLDVTDNKTPTYSSDPNIKDESSEQEVDLRAHVDAISFTDHDNEEIVAPDTKQAAKEVKSKLDRLCPNSKIGFLRIDDDGLTTLNFINPTPGEEEKVVDLLSITGGLTEGLPALPENKEDKRNKITPLNYLSYGPFSSFAPIYDSRISNITQAESDMLLSTYGGETEYMFAKSLQNFVQDCDGNLLNMVDDLLDTVTNKMHSKSINSILTDRQKDTDKNDSNDLPIHENTTSQSKTSTPTSHDITNATIKSGGAIQSQLNQTGTLIKNLIQTQNKRLSVQPPPGESNLQKPSTEEQVIATSIQNNLSSLVSKTTPTSLISESALNNLLGVQSQT